MLLRENLLFMTDDDAFDNLSEIAGQLKEHLQFYREIGVADIGGRSRTGPVFAARQTNESTEPTAVIPLPEKAEYQEPPHAEPTLQGSPGGAQFNLFGEPVSPPSAPRNAGRTAQTPQILSPLDASLEA